MWHDKYSIRDSMIPKFLSLSWVKKILATGKSINFLREVCQDTSDISGRDVVKANLDSMTVEHFFANPHGADSFLHETLQRAFADTSKHVLNILFNRYGVREKMSILIFILLPHFL